MSDVSNTVNNASAPAQEGSVCTGRCCACANRNVTCFMELEDAHYSDQTLAALVRYHGWSYCHPQRPEGGVKRLFKGQAPDGMLVPDGARYLVAGYAADPERRRYIALHSGWDLVVDFDGRNGSPAEIAQRLNACAEQFARQQLAQLEAA